MTKQIKDRGFNMKCDRPEKLVSIFIQLIDHCF